MNINTSISKSGQQSINNVHLFTSFSGNTNTIYASTSTNYLVEKFKPDHGNKSASYYTINLDWFQFICLTDLKGSVMESYSSTRITIIKNQTHNNPNFKYKYIVKVDHCDLCEIYAVPINCKHKKNEISVKVINSQLYTKDWFVRIRYLLDELGLTFSKLSKIDIALDGNDIYNKMDYFRRYLRTLTIQINNLKLKIEGINFNKQELKWEWYTIGRKKYQKTAEIYDKTNEIMTTGKHYITEFWKKNGLDTSVNNGRFEIKLGSRHLSKYEFDSFADFCDPAFLGKILFDEVNKWLRFYQVGLNDMKNHRKSTAIKNGKELTLIHWDKVPQTTIPLEKVITVSNGIPEAKKSITRTIGEILKGYTVDSTDTLVNFLHVTTTEYNIYDFTIEKINDAVKSNPKESNSLRKLQECLAEEAEAEINSGIANIGITQIDY